MQFSLLPTIDRMIELYHHPRDLNRFKSYIQLIQGDTKGDMQFPVGNFNPMGKPHVLAKLESLKALDAEQIITQIATRLSFELSDLPGDIKLSIALNLGDDLAGGWTNRFTTDYDSKFKLNAMITRQFCTPLFWTSEEYNLGMISARVFEYIYRSVYWLSNPKPKTLKDHIAQEHYVCKQTKKTDCAMGTHQFSNLQELYIQHKNSDSYPIIFNFLYGDEASRALGFQTFGATGEMPGYEFAKQVDKRAL